MQEEEAVAGAAGPRYEVRPDYLPTPEERT